jgi:hypothetical protein
MFFAYAIVPFLGGGTLLFCVVPLAVLYYRRRQKWDLVALAMSGVAVGVIVVERGLLLLLRGH